ncbi:MAG: diguanylate cyclase [Bacilli bacterium]|nr:diguanylate cyclase [Bacilli bacterium]
MIDEELKEKATAVFAENGLSYDAAVEAFLAQSVREGRLPFSMKGDNALDFRDLAFALAGPYIRLYYIDVETGHYVRYGTHSDDFSLPVEKVGSDFWKDVASTLPYCVYSRDLGFVSRNLQKDNLLKELEDDNLFTMLYRCVEEGVTVYHRLRATLVRRGERSYLVIGVRDADAQVKRENALIRKVKTATEKAQVDSLTGLKNKRAFELHRRRLRRKIKNGTAEFAVVVCDFNNLKRVNDTSGHQAGDSYLKLAAEKLQKAFFPSAIYRIGGDEFAIILEGEAYKDRDFIVSTLIDDSIKSLKKDFCVLAVGMGVFNPEKDMDVSSVFLRADMGMYENKQKLKEMCGL